MGDLCDRGSGLWKKNKKKKGDAAAVRRASGESHRGSTATLAFCLPSYFRKTRTSSPLLTFHSRSSPTAAHRPSSIEFLCVFPVSPRPDPLHLTTFDTLQPLFARTSSLHPFSLRFWQSDRKETEKNTVKEAPYGQQHCGGPKRRFRIDRREKGFSIHGSTIEEGVCRLVRCEEH